MISFKDALIGSVFLRLAWVFGFFCLLLVLHAVKTIYPQQGIIFWGYLVLTLTVFILYVNCFQKREGKIWVYALILSSCVIGFIPYENEIPRIYNLITNPNVKLSGLSNDLPFVIGVIVDVLFYPVLTFILLLASSVKIKK